MQYLLDDPVVVAILAGVGVDADAPVVVALLTVLVLMLTLQSSCTVQSWHRKPTTAARCSRHF